MSHENYMREAMKEAEKSANNGAPPFGVIVVDKNTEDIVWRDHDRVKENTDPTAHGEVNAIRGLCKKRNSTKLRNLIFYTTSEPCATCLSAMIKARVQCCYFGAPIEKDASLNIKAQKLAEYSTNNPMKIIGGVLEEECLKQRKYQL